MKFTIIVISSATVLLLISVLYDVNYFNYKSPIPYSRIATINFYDFKGLKKPGMTLSGSARFAYIKTSRKINFLSNGDVELTTYFHPSRSYVFAQDIRSADLLAHELYHFNISEYCSRLLRKRIFEMGKIITKKEIKRLNREYYKIEDEIQTAYDEDSYHSYVKQQQRNWEIKIDSLLSGLKNFSNTVIHIGNEK